MAKGRIETLETKAPTETLETKRLTETLEIRTSTLADILEVKYNNKGKLWKLRTRFILNFRQCLNFRRCVFWRDMHTIDQFGLQRTISLDKDRFCGTLEYYVIGRSIFGFYIPKHLSLQNFDFGPSQNCFDNSLSLKYYLVYW